MYLERNYNCSNCLVEPFIADSVELPTHVDNKNAASFIGFVVVSKFPTVDC